MGTVVPSLRVTALRFNIMRGWGPRLNAIATDRFCSGAGFSLISEPSFRVHLHRLEATGSGERRANEANAEFGVARVGYNDCYY